MKSQIDAALGALKNLPLWGSHRAADIQVFKFGKKVLSKTSRGEQVEVGEYAIHVQCP